MERTWRPTRETLRRAARSRTALATSALTCLALATLAGQVGTGAEPVSTATTTQVASASALDQVLGTLEAPSGKSFARGAGVLDSAASDAQAREAEQSEISATEVLAAPAEPTPVAGLDQVQMNNALRIVQTGQAMGLPRRAYIIAVATALQESQLRNLASTRIPESYQYNAEGEGSDHDSVGLFQQRTSAGWGRVSELMDPTYSASAFYSALLRVPGWESMELTWAAQRVQVSAFPYAYAKHEARATEIVDALLAHLAPAP